jgi:hypothetical protein
MALLAASAGDGKGDRPIRICGQVCVGEEIYPVNVARGEFVARDVRPDETARPARPALEVALPPERRAHPRVTLSRPAISWPVRSRKSV